MLLQGTQKQVTGLCQTSLHIWPNQAAELRHFNSQLALKPVSTIIESPKITTLLYFQPLILKISLVVFNDRFFFAYFIKTGAATTMINK